VKASVDSLERMTRYDPQLLDSPENLLCLEDHHQNHHHVCQDSLPRPPRLVHTATIHSLRSAPLSSHHRRNPYLAAQQSHTTLGPDNQLFRYFLGRRLVRIPTGRCGERSSRGRRGRGRGRRGRRDLRRCGSSSWDGRRSSGLFLGDERARYGGRTKEEPMWFGEVLVCP
jgi:hypothetical protein